MQLTQTLTGGGFNSPATRRPPAGQANGYAAEVLCRSLFQSVKNGTTSTTSISKQLNDANDSRSTMKSQRLTVRPIPPVVLSNGQIQKLVHVIKPVQLKLIDAVKPKRCKGIVSGMASSRLGGLNNPNFQSEYWKKISVVPVAWPHVATPKMKINDFRIME